MVKYTIQAKAQAAIVGENVTNNLSQMANCSWYAVTLYSAEYKGLDICVQRVVGFLTSVKPANLQTTQNRESPKYLRNSNHRISQYL